MPQFIPILVYAIADVAELSPAVVAALTVVSAVAVSIYEKQEAESQARAEARAALQDRLITIRSGVAPRQYIVGQVRTGGAQLYVETTGLKAEALDTVTAFAANQCVLTDWFVGDDRIDVNDFPGSKYGRQTNFPIAENFTVTGPSANVSVTEKVSSPIHATWRQAGAVGTATAVNSSGLTVTLTGLPVGSSQVTLSYQSQQDAFLRGQFKAGLNSQTPTNWSGYSTPDWDVNHRLAGTAHTRTLNIWDLNSYQNGAPAITIAAIGRCIDGFPFFDPRDSSNPVDTSNPAIWAAYWLTLPRSYGGWGIPSDWIDWDSVSAAANICDEMIVVKTLDGTGTEAILRYSCDTVLSTDADPVSNFMSILSAMAGTYAFTGGKYRIFAGAFRPATVTLTDNDVVGTSSISVNTASAADTPPNIVTSTFADASQAWVSSSPKQVENDDYIAADGFESPLDLQLKATTDARRARYLMGVALERGRPAFGITLTVGGIGENLALYDTVQLNLVNRAAYAGRTFEIVGLTENWDGSTGLTLSEIKSTTFVLDPDSYTPVTPVVPPNNSYLWSPPDPTSFVVTAVTPQTLPDGTTVSRVSLAWDPIASAGATPGSQFNIRYRTTGGQWIGAAPVPGDAISTVITTALQNGEMYQWEIQFQNGIGAMSDWVDAYTGINGTPLPTAQSLRLAASSLIFRVPATGNALPVSIALQAVRSGGLAGTSVWSTSPAVTLTGSGDTRTLTFANDTVDSVSITVSITAGSTVYTDTQTIAKVYDGASATVDLTAPPTPTGLTVTPFLLTLGVNWDAPTFTVGHGYDSTIVYAAKVLPSPAAQPTFANATPVGSSSTTAYNFPTTTGTKWAFWIKHQTADGVRSITPAGGTNGVQGQTGLIGTTDLAPLLIDASKLASGAVTAAAMAANAVTSGSVAPGAITNTKIAVGAVTTDRLLVTGRGAALNDDPSCSDATAWSGTQMSFVTITDGAAGNTAMRSGLTSSTRSRAFAIDPTKTYRLRGWVRNTGGNGVLYLRAIFEDAAGATVDFWGGLEAVNVPSAFTLFSTNFGVGTAKAIPSTAKLCQIEVDLNWTGTTGHFDAQDLRIEEAIEASLIVQGAITADKLGANSIAVGTAAIQNGAIVNAMIGAAAIDNAKIADASINTAKIADLSVNTSKIANAAIQTAQIADGSISSAKIGDAQITNAKIGDLEVDSAKIQNLTIGTGKIGGNAVTGSAAATSVQGNNSPACSFSYTSQGGVLVIIASGTYTNTQGSSTNRAMSLSIDGGATVWDQVSDFLAPGGTARYSTAYSVTLPAGVHSFALNCSTATSQTYLNASLVLIELKR